MSSTATVSGHKSSVTAEPAQDIASIIPAERHVSMVLRIGYDSIWVWKMLYGEDTVIDLVRVPSKGAIYAACLQCPMVMDSQYWSVQKSVAMHKHGTGHRKLAFVVPQPHEHNSWCATACEPSAEAES